MQAIIHNIYAIAPLVDLRSWEPDDPGRFCVRVQVMLGPDEAGTGPEVGADGFDVTVCTPRWLAEQFEARDLTRLEGQFLQATSAWHQLAAEKPSVTPTRAADEPDPILFGIGFLFMRRWDFGKLESTIQALCATIEGPEWGAVASRIGRLLPWEYEHRYDRAVDAGQTFQQGESSGEGAK
jgi:hypothetical protein